ncbi:MAG: N-acyl-D-amino-acid deacylase family protein [Streptomycetales bacterium]
MHESECLITGGTVVGSGDDGGGDEPRQRDVWIRGEKIVAVEEPGLIAPDGRTVVDASGLIVTPGFIDTHSHADNAPLLPEDDTSKILQGVTTEVVGNCGFSLAPCSAEHQHTLARLLERIFPPTPLDWREWSELDTQLESGGSVTNYAPLVGHGTLRIAAFGMVDRAPDGDELAAMRRGLHDALEAGVFGLSTGLIYPPGVYSTTEEITRLAEVLGPDRVYATHMRGESDGLLDSIDEALRIGRNAGCPVHISHLKWFGKHNWGRMPDALDLISAAAEAGLPVTDDVYPYTAGSTFLASCLPPPLLVDGDEAVLAKLRDPAQRGHIARTIAEGLPGWDNMVANSGWDGILVSTTASHAYEGLTLAQIGQKLRVAPVDALIHVLVEERLQASMVAFGLSEDDMIRVLAYPRTMVGSDSLPPGRGGRPHPRTYGTFPRYLGGYVRDREVLPLGEAVHRITAMPAATFRIPDRGQVRPGYIADLVAFDPERLTDHCDYLDPVQHPTGIAWVMLAGEMVAEGGRFLGRRRGRRLTPGSTL